MLADLERAIANGDPQLGELIVRYVAQPDPEPGRPELAPTAAIADERDPFEPPPAGAFDHGALSRALAIGRYDARTATERKLARIEAFRLAEASPFAPPRLRLGRLLLALDERGDDFGRAALLHVFAHAHLKWGIWQAAKAIYKRAEARHDAAMFGVLAYRFDAMANTPFSASELGGGTLLYLRRRAWRFLRQLGTAVPDAYPTFAVEVLRHYPHTHPSHANAWVAGHIWNHGALRAMSGIASFAPPTTGDPFAARAFVDTWKLSPSPLLRLLDSAWNEQVCDWAIRCLRHDHALALRAVEPAWLARLGARPVAAIHGFVVALLKDSPEFHQSKLRALGLHEVVIGFLRSPSPEARAYALDYAAAHGGDLAIDSLVELCELGAPEVAKFAAARLEALTPDALGVVNAVRLLGRAAAPWAPAKLAQGFEPHAIGASLFVETALRDIAALNQLIAFFNGKRVAIPAAHWIELLDHRAILEGNRGGPLIAAALAELGKRAARELGVAWIQQSLERPERTAAVAGWLDAGMLSGADLDLEWLKRLVGKPRLRPIALRLLGDRRRVRPAAVGLEWLLELTRSPEIELAKFAQRMLLESFEPADFADGDAAPEAGLARLWALATGAKQKDAVRAFAATYLLAHHPVLGPRQPEAKALGITPRLARAAYPLATVRPLFDDPRADVRRLAVAIAREELVPWDDRALVYALASAAHREPRALGSELLLGFLGAEPALPGAWLDGERVFQLAEGGHKATREVALTLIRKLYARIGGAERLAWLMDSPERDVRLFAVRLFWDRHRPKPWPDDLVPRAAIGAPLGSERFADLAALRQFARIVLFGLPPGRVGERDPVIEGGAKPERALPASVAKRRLIEAMRDVALDDVDFARAIAPVLTEFTHSTAKGEWHASVQALTQLRARHADLERLP